MNESNYQHDAALGHDFFALTGMTDECRRCGCKVGETMNWAGAKGGRFDQPCLVPLAPAKGGE